jgi:hypothetical protein
MLAFPEKPPHKHTLPSPNRDSLNAQLAQPDEIRDPEKALDQARPEGRADLL